MDPNEISRSRCMSHGAALINPCYQFISILLWDEKRPSSKAEVARASFKFADLPHPHPWSPSALVRYSWDLSSHARQSHGRVGNVPVLEAPPHVGCVRDVQLHPRIWSSFIYMRLAGDTKSHNEPDQAGLDLICSLISQRRTGISQTSSAHHHHQRSFGSSETSQP